MNSFFRKHQRRISRAALMVLAYFLVQIVVINPVFCLPTGGGANIEMCVLDFQCPCVCDHHHEEERDEAGAYWVNPCKICLDIPISLGNDLIPDGSPQSLISDVELGAAVQSEPTISINPLAFLHPKDHRPPGIPPTLLFCVQLC
jgi:hypothetical protein